MKIVEKESFWVMGIQVQATYNHLWEKMPEAWKQFYQKLPQISHRKNDVSMDISFGKNQYGIYTQFIGAEIEEPNITVPQGMQKLQISANKYLHHTHDGELKEIANSFKEMYDWANANNLKAGEFKLDIGYKDDDQINPHQLYIEILD